MMSTASAAKTNLSINYVDVEEYEDVFKLIEQKEVDAGILPRLFGDLNERRFDVTKTTTISHVWSRAQNEPHARILDTSC